MDVIRHQIWRAQNSAQNIRYEQDVFFLRQFFKWLRVTIRNRGTPHTNQNDKTAGLIQSVDDGREVGKCFLLRKLLQAVIAAKTKQNDPRLQPDNFLEPIQSVLRRLAGNPLVLNRSADFLAQQSRIIVARCGTETGGETVAESNPISRGARREVGVRRRPATSETNERASTKEQDNRQNFPMLHVNLNNPIRQRFQTLGLNEMGSELTNRGDARVF